MLFMPRAAFGAEDGGAAAVTQIAGADSSADQATETHADDAADGAAATGQDADDGDVQPDGTAEAGQDAEAEEQPEAGEEADEGAPEAYEFTLPEGFDGLDQEAMAAAEPLLRAKNVDQKTAQQFVDIVAGTIQRQVQRAQQGIAEQREQRSAEWLEELQADKEFGGAKFDANTAGVRGVIEKFGDTDPDFVFPEGHVSAGQPVPGGAVKKLLSEAGIGNARPIIMMLHRLAKATGEDSTSPGDGIGGVSALTEQEFMAEVFAKSRKS